MSNRVSTRAIGALALSLLVWLGGCPTGTATPTSITPGAYSGEVESITTGASGAMTRTTFTQAVGWDGSMLTYDGTTPLTEGRNFVSPGPAGDLNWTVRVVTVTNGVVRVESDFESTAELNGTTVTYAGEDVTTVTPVDDATVTFEQTRTLRGTLPDGSSSTVQQTASGTLRL